MTLTKSLKNNLSPYEISFFAENELITILPKYSMNEINLIGVSSDNISVKNILLT